MTACPSFSEIVNASSIGWCEKKGDEGVLSIALPLQGADPLALLPLIAKEQHFRFLWDEEKDRSVAAAGYCQKIELAGPKRFELAQRFSDAIFGKLTNASPRTPAIARPRILVAFSFFTQAIERLQNLDVIPAMQAVLPKWQISRQGKQAWLRLNGIVTHEADARELAEKLWLMKEAVENHSPKTDPSASFTLVNSPTSKNWQGSYIPALSKGIELVESGELHKLVLAVRQSIQLKESLDPLRLLSRLRKHQTRSCRFLWQRQSDEAFFGASPEKLLKMTDGKLYCDALAGTASCNENGSLLLQSNKDRLEHELVVNAITKQLIQEGINPIRPRQPQLAQYGKLVHLHTPITANLKNQRALLLAEKLHPTPAVAGLPRKEAMSWLRTLEPFERGNYAAPIGWIDSQGDSELRVAIRCGTSKGRLLELTAGAGLVKGSIAEKELEEVGLKLTVLADQLSAKTNSQDKDPIRQSII